MAGRLESVINQAPVAIIVFDNALRIVEWNEAAFRLFGVLPADAAGRLVGDFFVVEVGDGPGEWMEMVRRTGNIEMAGHGRMPDGEPFPVHIVAAGLFRQQAERETVLYVVRSGYGPREMEACARMTRPGNGRTY